MPTSTTASRTARCKTDSCKWWRQEKAKGKENRKARAYNCRALSSGGTFSSLVSREPILDIVDNLTLHLVGLLSIDRLPELLDLAQDADVGLHLLLGLFGA